MAFTGTPVVVLVADSMVRVTGISLAGAAHGTIALTGYAGSPDVTLPAQFQPKDYTNDAGVLVHLSDSLKVDANFLDTVDPDMVPLQIVKSGTKPADFLITVYNNPTGDGPPATGALEFYIGFHN